MAEKITETKFTTPGGIRILSEYFFNEDATVTVRFNGSEDSRMPGNIWFSALSTKQRSAMNKVQRDLYDFLSVRLSG